MPDLSIPALTYNSLILTWEGETDHSPPKSLLTKESMIFFACERIPKFFVLMPRGVVKATITTATDNKLLPVVLLCRILLEMF